MSRTPGRGLTPGLNRYTPYSRRSRANASGSAQGTTVSALPSTVRNALSAGGKSPTGEIDEQSKLSLVTCGSPQGNPQTFVFVWKHSEDGMGSPLQSVQLADDASPHFVRAVELAEGGVSIIACSGGGDLKYWPDASNSSQVVTEKLELAEDSEGAAEVSAFVAAATPAIRSASTVAVAGCRNGTLMRVECDKRGFTLTHHFDRDATADPPAAGGLAGILRTPGKVIGSLLRSPGALLRSGASIAGEPVRALAWRPVHESRARPQLLSLTANGVECWEVELVAGGTERRLWAHRVMSALLSRLPSPDVTLVDLVAVDQEIYLLAACPDDGNVSYFVSSLSCSASDFDVLWTEKVADVPAAAVRDPGAARLAAAPGRAAVRAPDGSLRLAMGLGGGAGSRAACAAVEADGALGRTLAVAACEDGWLALGDVKGVTLLSEEAVAEMAAEGGGVASSGPPEGSSAALAAAMAAAAGTPVSPAPAAAAAPAGRRAAPHVGSARSMERDDVIAGELRVAFEKFVAGSATGHSADALRGAAEGDAGGPSSVFGAQSRQVIDTLAKHWGQGVAAVAVDQQLEEKGRKHAQYLEFLDVVGCLPALETPTLASVLADGERLAAVAELRRLWNAKSDRGKEGAEGAGAKALMRLAELAGQALSDRESGLAGRPRWEVFYSRASAVSKFFEVVAAEAEASARADNHADAGGQFAAASTIAQALLKMIEAAEVVRARHREAYPAHAIRAAATAGYVPWTAGPETRAALRAAARLCVALRPALRAGAPAHLPALRRTLGDLAGAALAAFAAGVEALPPRGDERRALFKQYAEVAGETLGAMLAWSEEAGDYEGVMEVAALAEHHLAYEQLAQVCKLIDTGEEARYQYMRSLPGSAADGVGPFATFMYERWRASGMHVALLTLPDEFSASLAAYLAAHPRLQWLHQVRLEDYSSAGDTLAALAAKDPSTRAERRRRLYLGKIAALAAPGGAAPGSLLALDAGLELLGVEEAAGAGGKVSPEGAVGALLGDVGQEAEGLPLAPMALVDLCLEAGKGDRVLQGDRGKVALAFSVFAMAGDAFRAQNRTKMEACWLRAAELSDWAMIAEAREVGSDGDYGRALAATPLFACAARCFGPGAASVGGPFAQAMAPGDVQALVQRALGEGAAVQAALDAIAMAQAGEAAGGWGAEGSFLEGASAMEFF